MKKLLTYLIAGVTFMILGCVVESLYEDAMNHPQQNRTAVVQNK